MAQKVLKLTNGGMIRDVSVSKAPNKYAYENRNIRLTPLDHETLLSVTNEKGPAKIPDITLEGAVIGHCVLNENLIVFTTSDKDRIYKLTLGTNWTEDVLYEGELGFSVDAPIETLGLYESEGVQKVYWVDGINQPRVINITQSYTYSGTSVDTRFDFVTAFNSNVNVNIEKEYIGNGTFHSGVIQYYLTYFNQFGQETNIVWQSPQYYLSEENKGASPEDTVGCSFKIQLNDLDEGFDHVRIYSLIRTGYNTEPQLYIVGETAIPSGGDEVIITDNGVYSESLDPTVLLYVGGVEISASTLTQKDNTLFLGNIVLKSNPDDESLKEAIDAFITANSTGNYLRFIKTSSTDETGRFTIPYYSNTGYYPYTNAQLDSTSYQIKTFKGGETYRIGVRFFTKTGAGTYIYWLGDIFNPIYPSLEATGKIDRAVLQFDFTPELNSYLVAHEYQQFQLYMAEATSNDRSVLAQGVLSPTVFNLRQRCSNSPFTMSSWFFRFNNGEREYEHFQQLPPEAVDVVRDEDSGEVMDFALPAEKTMVEIQGICENTPVYINNTEGTEESSLFYQYQDLVIYIVGWLPLDGYKCYFQSDYTKLDREGNVIGKGTVITRQFGKGEALAAATAFKKQLNDADLPGDTLITTQGLVDFYNTVANRIDNIQYLFGPPNTVYLGPNGTTVTKNNAQKFDGYTTNSTSSMKQRFIQEHGVNFYVDQSFLTFHSPEINSESTVSTTNWHLRIVGYTEVTSNISNYRINASAPENGVRTVLNKTFSSSFESEELKSGICSYPLWQDITKSGFNSLYWMYPWHKTGSISKIEKMNTADKDNPVGTGEYYSVLENKTWANMFYCYDTVFMVNPEEVTSSSDIGWKNISLLPGGGISDIPADYIRFISDTPNAVWLVQQNERTYNYQGDCDMILSFNSSQNYPIINSGIENASSSEDNILNTYNSEIDCYDSVNIAYKSTPHALVSLNDILKRDPNDSSMKTYRAILPNMSDTPVAGTLEGDLPWEDLYGENMQYLTLMTYEEGNIYFTVTSLGDNTYQIMNDDADDWEKYISPYIDNESDIYFCYKDTSGSLHIMRLLSLDIEKPKLPTPEFTGSINSGESPLKLTIVITPVVDASGYEVNIIDSSGGSVYSQTVQNTTVEVEILEEESYTVTIIAKGNDLYNDSDPVTHTYSSESINLSQSSLSLEYNDMSAHTVTLSSTAAWQASQSVSSFSTRANPNKIITVTALEQSQTSTPFNNPLFFNDIRYGNRYEWNPDNKEITAPKKGSSDYYSDALSWNVTTDKPYLFVAEIYKDYDSETAYGGTSEYAKRNNTFIPISERYTLNSQQHYYGVEGDTFFQRYDCLKTEPYSEGKENSIVEMISFMVETHENIEGRYDNRRGLLDNLATTSTNMNHINPVYSQPDNFITGVYTNDAVKNTMFPSQITWTKTKTFNEDIDTWTNITLASVLDLDGDKGNVTALKRLGNTVIAFQDKGISEILYNTRTQMAVTSGVPVELANSGKVDGKRYISDKIGCPNKWSIVEASTGIYFIDNINSSISVFNGSSIQSVSNTKGFKSWIQQKNSMDIWNPRDFSNFIGFYDRANDDIYFINADEALCFNEMLNEFTSFYSYGNTPVMATVQDRFIALRNNALWEMHEGEYNNYFGEYKPFSITYKVVPDSYTDKTFTNIEYKADVFDSTDTFLPDVTFNTLDVWNEYQRGHVDLDFLTPMLSNLKRKFRNWAAFIPRDMKDNKYGYNRIRNPWIYMKLEMNDNLENTRMEIHDMIVRYL